MIPPRDGWIDSLRALSAVAVVLFHFNVLPTVLPPGPVAAAWRGGWSYGYLGVAVFFVLSGYCLLPGWQRSLGLADFLRRRVLRIMPPYWCSLLLLAGLAVGGKILTGVNDIAALPRSPGTVAATLLLLTDPVTTLPALNWVYWSLSFLLVCYLLIGLLQLLPRPARIGALVGLHDLLCLIDLAFHPEPHGALFFIRYWPVFGLGLALALLALDRPAGRVMLGLSLVHAAWSAIHWPDFRPFLLVGGLTAGLLVLARSRPFPRGLVPLAEIGRFSYSLYLVHVPVGILVLMRLTPVQFTSALQFILTQLLLLAATVAAARLFYLLAERPFLPRART